MDQVQPLIPSWKSEWKCYALCTVQHRATSHMCYLKFRLIKIKLNQDFRSSLAPLLKLSVHMGLLSSGTLGGGKSGTAVQRGLNLPGSDESSTTVNHLIGSLIKAFPPY
jgi:hypothetical protein